MSQIINNDTIEEVRSVMKDKLPMMVEYYLEDSAVYISSIGEGLASNDVEKIKPAAHTLKSSSAQLGAERVSEIAKEIEHDANNMIENGGSDFSQIKQLFEGLKAAFAEAEPEFKKIIGWGWYF